MTATGSYDDPQNADLIAVIDRRRGLPVAWASSICMRPAPPA